MKKFVSLLLAFSLALCLAACGGSASSAVSGSAASSEAASSEAASSEAAASSAAAQESTIASTRQERQDLSCLFCAPDCTRGTNVLY